MWKSRILIFKLYIKKTEQLFQMNPVRLFLLLMNSWSF